MKDRNKIIVAGVIACLLFGAVGYGFGFSQGVNFTVGRVVNLARGFIDIDYSLVNQALFQYYNNVGGCFNASTMGR